MQPLLVHMIQPGHFWSYPSFESTLTDISPVCIQRMNLTVFAAGSLDAWNNFPPLCYSLARLHNEQPLLPVLHMSTGFCLCGPGWKSTGIDQQTRLMCCDKENIFEWFKWLDWIPRLLKVLWTPLEALVWKLPALLISPAKIHQA